MKRKFSASFKTQVAIEAIKGLKTINQIASEFEIHPNQVTDWKKLFLSNCESVFSKGEEKKVKHQDDQTAKLYEKIGKLEVENDFLKKKLFPNFH